MVSFPYLPFLQPVYALGGLYAVGAAAREQLPEAVENISYGAGYNVGRTTGTVSNAANTAKWVSVGLLAVGGIVIFSFLKNAVD